MLSGARRGGRERGQVMVLFALLLPVLIGLGSVVIGVGNWYTHGRHLQTKADAGALAGGGSWAFPCGPQIDQRIETQARTYIGPHTQADGSVFTGPTYNAQVGGVGASQVHAVLNGGGWYDDDANPPNAVDRVDPPGSICESRTLDVKLTEDNVFPLFSLLPFFPDIKRKARVEIREAEGLNGLLPIAVRAPEPVSAAAVFYNEANGNILAVKYLVRDPGIAGLPGSLQGWTTFNSEDPSPWASFQTAATTGIVLAVSFRGACNTGLPNPNTKITTQAAPCFEDNLPTVSQLCNQGGSTQIVNCYFASGSWPSEQVEAGLHFLRGYADTNPGNGPPGLENAWLDYLTCSYFNAHPNNSCQARLNVTLDLGTLLGQYQNPNPPPGQIQAPLRASDVEVRYCRVTPASAATNPCSSQFGAAQELIASSPDATGTVTFSTTASPSTHPTFTAGSGENAFAIQVRLRNAQNHANPSCANSNYNAGCRYRYTATLVTTNDLTRDQILNAPVQRSFRGTSVTSGPAQWLRLTTDLGCNGLDYMDNEAGNAPTSTPTCFVLDVGLKGGIARDADEPGVLFADGIGASQLGTLDCDPTLPQGQELIEGIKKGCNLFYARHPFDWSPLCPSPNNLFTTPNPGPPWDDGRWPPIRCIKTRPTSSANQMERGFKGRLFGNENQSTCPADSATAFVKGRNYWKQGTNLNPLYGYKDDNPSRDTFFSPGDPRLVTIFLAPTEAFSGSGQATYPVVGFISIYVTGFGRISGNGGLSIDDPCPGSAPPSDLDLSGGSSGGYAVWGHILNYVVPSPNATPSGRLCNPGQSAQPCVATLVE